MTRNLSYSLYDFARSFLLLWFLETVTHFLQIKCTFSTSHCPSLLYSILVVSAKGIGVAFFLWCFQTYEEGWRIKKYKDLENIILRDFFLPSSYNIYIVQSTCVCIYSMTYWFQQQNQKCSRTRRRGRIDNFW